MRSLAMHYTKHIVALKLGDDVHTALLMALQLCKHVCPADLRATKTGVPAWPAGWRWWG